MSAAVELLTPGFNKTAEHQAANPWFYLPSIDTHLNSETQELLETYSKIPRDQQSKHVHEIRDEAWAVRGHPCTGLGVWLIPFISMSPAYPVILERMKAGGTFMDVGCFIGQDLRKLVYDGAPSNNMYGVDIVSHWDVGYSMYHDKDTFAAKFIEADMLSDHNPELMKLKGKMDVIEISAVMHQWDWDKQVEAASKLVAYSKPGSMVVGYQMGNIEGKQLVNKSMKLLQWRHDPKTFERMWNQVGKDTGTTWETKAWLRSWEDMGWNANVHPNWKQPGDMALDFCVTRKR